jgi:hypothetical protein
LRTSSQTALMFSRLIVFMLVVYSRKVNAICPPSLHGDGEKSQRNHTIFLKSCKPFLRRKFLEKWLSSGAGKQSAKSSRRVSYWYSTT